MSKSFKKVTLGELEILDILPIGRLKGCRICDVIETDYEYLIWLYSMKYIKLSQTVITKVEMYKLRDQAEQHYKEEIEPWEKFDDVPW